MSPGFIAATPVNAGIVVSPDNGLRLRRVAAS
jgi:hypothetical protein